MSTDDHLFFDPGHSDIHVAATQLAAAVGGRFRDDEITAVSVDLSPLQPGSFLTGLISVSTPIETVDPTDPTDREIFDDYPLLWSMRTGPTSDEQFARAAARVVFDRLSASDLPWSLVLDHGFGELIATYDVERGVRDFPAGTRPDGTDEHLWR